MLAESATNPVCSSDGCEVYEAPWGRIMWSVSRQVGNSARLTFGRATIRAGEQNPRHRHPNCDEVLHLLSGRLEHTLGDKQYVMEAGDTISIPQGVWHQARAIGEEDAETVICFSSADRMTEVDESAAQ